MNAIKHIRSTILQVNQEAFAKAAGVTQPTISRWEKGECSPSMDEMRKLCEAFPTIKPADFFNQPPAPDQAGNSETGAGAS